MSINIGGKKREQLENTEFAKKVGLFEAKVIAINPSVEEYKDILNMELKEDSKLTEYLSKSRDDNDSLKIDIWLQEIKNNDKFKVTFFLENKPKVNKDGTKKQYINSVGQCTWADDPNNLPEWYTKREYRVAFEGEELLFNFLRTWFGNLDLRDSESTLQLEWKKLMKGNVKDLRDQIGGEWVTNVVALATIKTVEKEDGTKEYQSVYNKSFLAPYNLKQFRLLDYQDDNVLRNITTKKPKDLKPHERFVKDVVGEYGCKDYYILKDLREYTSGDNLVASDKVIAEDDSDY